MLVEHVKARPEVAPLMLDTDTRAVYTHSTPTHPPLCLYYSFDDTTIYLLYVEEWDSLVGD